MLCFHLAKPTCRGIPATAQIRHTSCHIMGVGCQDMYQPLIQHPFSPILRSFTKSASQRTRRDLVPHSGTRHTLYDVVVLTQPAQAFRVRQNWYIPCDQDVKEELLHALGRHVMGWFYQNVPRIRQGQDAPRPECLDKVWANVRIRPNHQIKRNPGLIQGRLQVTDKLSNLRASVVI